MHEHLKKDPLLKKVIEQASQTLSLALPKKDIYLALVRSIVGQQLSVKAAATIYQRFRELFPENYPTPKLVVAAELDTLKAAGLSKQKATYIKNVAAFAIEGGLDFEVLNNQTDEEIIQVLITIKGVGRWTVEMLLMFAFQRPDVFSVDDLGIQQAVKKLYQLDEEGKALKAKMKTIANAWKPYRTLACLYLWQWKDNTPIDNKNAKK
ncbi:DNA-3-methyladenine glycosylase family protein [Microscilla marina]|uniref:DNA-3-methyladenine glycosylase II n=1 Tax=Microscilla marina ATCC 23134 TaxID=313606 RepID=A1ZCF3_MICM2|nr:DNA-3-methyladenine glycosylase [Microscilla marina]EAY31955.1 HhH-GPD [Microscilla marina ATCC 23134]